ncbi:sugar transferase [Paenibacillus xylaniclasticus]|uniref:sugar transferase n=1 Tax=Paenibacillus xylaniclasticus TaxID=588083 RepID=UPI000FD6CD5D|nr:MULTISPECIES: sugar transferase [Paenibacillus]GFN29866.1 multidrug MFS transporter [Paenibacillus curdlanolyticus]
MTPQGNDVEVALESNAYYSAHALEQDKRIRAYLIMKRTIDIVGAAVGIFVLLPLFIGVAILIKLEDPRGPVFFHQKRVGKNGIPFRMYKFRSMVSNAEELLETLLSQNEVEGHMFKMKHDPRVTRIGRCIRKTSIDELPQLVNVLKGDMSLVGPRPPLPREVKEYSAHDKKRLSVIPGCTGLWQVSGRSQLSFDQMVELDLRYIKERSIWLDFKIMLRTILLIFGSKNAY